MSEHQQAQNTTQLNPNLVAFIFIFTFTITGIVIISNMRPQSPQRQQSANAEVALAESATSVVPSNTPVPPTNTALPTAEATTQSVADAGQASTGNMAVNYDPALVAKGEQLFMTCSACHGADALGLPNLGKNLVDSEFIHSLSDADLLTFVKTGRPIWDALNTTGIDMPPKGGNPAFSDDDILAIIAYIRSISTASGQSAPPLASGAESTALPMPSQTPLPLTSTSAPLPTNTVLPTSAGESLTPATNSNSQVSGGNTATSYDPTLVVKGEQLFMTCSACHGIDARGIPNLGKNLVDSEFVHSLSDTDLLNFIKTGRPSWDTLNTTGIDMPPKGGNPAFTDEDLLAIIAYVRSLATD